MSDYYNSRHAIERDRLRSRIWRLIRIGNEEKAKRYLAEAENAALKRENEELKESVPEWFFRKYTELEAELVEKKDALAEAAREINCAGPVAHRIRILKKGHQAEKEVLRKAYKKIQDADSPDLKLPVAMTIAMAEMIALLTGEKGRDCHTVECTARLLAGMDCICGFTGGEL